MGQQTIGIGSTADDKTGDPLRTAFTKINDNFDELYTFTTNDVFYRSGSNVSITSGNITLDPTLSVYFAANLNANIANVIVSNNATINQVIEYQIELTNGDGQPHFVNWPRFWRWPGNTRPTLSTTVGNIDLITVKHRNTGVSNLWLATSSIGHYTTL